MEISTGLGLFYLFCGVMNGVASLYMWLKLSKPVAASVWTVISILFVVAGAFWIGGGAPFLILPESVKAFVDYWMTPATYTCFSFVGLVFLFLLRRFFCKPMVAWAMLNLSFVVMGFAMTDADFALVIAKPDNVPIVAMIYLLGYFTWLATWKAVQNDDRLKQGLPPLEKLDDEKVLVWPDLVYTELICMIALVVILTVWSVVLAAPLEEPGSTVKTPNPSKAPWYFLGLQEMLVYYDPWMAGVVLPSLVLFGLIAIPFIDFNKKGNGYYTIDERKFAYTMFQFGFLELWVVLIVMGTFLRGPNWNFFGPFEEWDVHKVEALNNKDVSQLVWGLMNTPMPKAPVGSPWYLELLYIGWRECVGIAGVVAFFVLSPPLMAMTIFRKFFVKMGFIRFMILANLLLFMASLPIKMICRWLFNLKYFVAIPEYFLNF